MILISVKITQSLIEISDSTNRHLVSNSGIPVCWSLIILISDKSIPDQCTKIPVSGSLLLLLQLRKLLPFCYHHCCKVFSCTRESCTPIHVCYVVTVAEFFFFFYQREVLLLCCHSAASRLMATLITDYHFK